MRLGARDPGSGAGRRERGPRLWLLALVAVLAGLIVLPASSGARVRRDPFRKFERYVARRHRLSRGTLRHADLRHGRSGGAHAQAHAAIVGGRVAEEDAFPWMAFVVDFHGETASVCSGTVVAPRLVLTAGHCAENVETGTVNNPSGYAVVTGTADWAQEAHRQLSHVSRLLVYPGFDRSRLVGDAALLELATPTTAPAITLAGDLSGLPMGTEATIAGWGETADEKEQQPAESLRSAETVVQGTEYCDRNVSPFYPESQTCTLDTPSDSTSTCYGDSGGPLLAHWPTGGALVEIGITSTGSETCSPTFPDVFTRTDMIASWVNEWISEPTQALKRQEELTAINKHVEEETAAKKHAEEEATAKKRQEEEATAKQRQEEEAGAKKRQEEEATAKKRQEEAVALTKEQQATATKKLTPTITWHMPAKRRVGSSGILSARSSSRADAKLSSATPAVCRLTRISNDEQAAGVSRARVRFRKTGKCTIIARLKEATAYEAAEARRSLRVLARKKKAAAAGDAAGAAQSASETQLFAVSSSRS